SSHRPRSRRPPPGRSRARRAATHRLAGRGCVRRPWGGNAAGMRREEKSYAHFSGLATRIFHPFKAMWNRARPREFPPPPPSRAGRGTQRPVLPSAKIQGGAAMAEKTSGGWPEVLRAFLKLGLTSFGGPVAHLGYFRAEFVARRAWLTEPAYADLVAL